MLASVPYAMKAHDAETINGLPASAFVLASLQPLKLRAARRRTFQCTSAAAITGSGTAGSAGLYQRNNDRQWPYSRPDHLLPRKSGSTPTLRRGARCSRNTNLRGSLTLPSAGTATATAGKNSQPIDLKASAFNITTKSAVPQTYQLQAEPINNDTGNASATLNLLFGAGASTPAETGFKINKTGVVTFAPGQTFPGTVASVGLTAPSSDFTVSGSPVKGSGTWPCNGPLHPHPSECRMQSSKG
jgi:hypothetical protein